MMMKNFRRFAMRNGAINIRDRLRRRCSITSSIDLPVNRSEDESLSTSGSHSLKDAARVRKLRNEASKELHNIRQRHGHTLGVRAGAKESSDDEKHPSKKRKYYIVADGEQPSELYRTDLLHKMKADEDSDATSDDEPTYVRLSDRWREEWNHGVQVPLYEHLPEFIVHDKPCTSSSTRSSSPQKQVCFGTLRNANLISVHNKRYVGNKHTRVTMSPLRHYQVDQTDRLYVLKLNKERANFGLPLISEELFGVIMDKLEVYCYKAMHYDLLAPLTLPIVSPSKGAEFDENAFCDICRQPDFEEDDKIIFCDGCNLSVHQSCYGLDSVPANEWICKKCLLLGQNSFVGCVLCPLVGGAMKCTKDGEIWAHVVCALWTPEVRFTDVDHREPIANFCDIPNERWILKCSVCDTKQGSCIQCTEPTCTTAFHVTCGLRSGQIMRIEHDGSDDDDGVQMISLCDKHSQMSTANAIDLYRSSVRNVPTRLFKLPEMERIFFLYVSVSEVANVLHVSEEMVNDVFEYWKLRRADSGYKPMFTDVSELELEIAQRLQSSQPANVLSEITLRQNLERVRNLCYMIERREKKKKEVYACWLDTYMKVYTTLKEKRVPYSNRALEHFSAALKMVKPPVSASALLTGSVNSSAPAIILPLAKKNAPTKIIAVSNKLATNSSNLIREKNGPNHHPRLMQAYTSPRNSILSKNNKQMNEASFTGQYNLRGMTSVFTGLLSKVAGKFDY